MNFEDERYVRLYTRDTVTWKLLKWQGKCLLPLLLRKVDRAGCADLDGAGIEGVAALAEIPLEVVEPGFQQLLERGVVEVRGDVLIFPKFLAAQEARQSDRARQEESRSRKRDAVLRQPVTSCDQASQNVTGSHEFNQNVTAGHAVSHDVTPYRTVPCSAQPKSEPNGSVAMTSARSPLPNPQPALLPDALPPQVARKTREPKPKAETTPSASALVWSAYAAAFTARYGTEPTRNARVNAQIAQFVGRVPAEEAPQIAAFYLRHSAAFYAGQMHSVGLLLRDAEKLRAEWQRGQTVNMTEARRNEQTAANPFLEELAERRRARAAAVQVECRVEGDDVSGK